MLKNISSPIQEALGRKENKIESSFGNILAEEIDHQLDKSSLLRRFLPSRDLKIGEPTKSLKRDGDAASYFNDTNEIVDSNQVEVYPLDLYTNEILGFELKELNLLSEAATQEKIKDLLESLRYKEESLLEKLVLATKNKTSFSKMTLLLLQEMSNSKSGKFFISKDLWTDFITDESFVDAWAPTDSEELLTGFLGMIKIRGLTLEIHCDVIHGPKKVFPDGVIIFFEKGVGENLVRKRLKSNFLDQSIMGVPKRGWFFNEIHAPYIYLNHLAVASVA